MLAVIFELEPREGKVEAYLAIAKALKEELETIEGFISIERFESLARPGRYMSLSFWRDEAAVERWRTLSTHRAAQSQGRAEIFADYRLRVAQVVRDYGMTAREEAPRDSQTHHG